MPGLSDQQIAALQELDARRATLAPEQAQALDELKSRAGIAAPETAADPAPEDDKHSFGGLFANILPSAGKLAAGIGNAVAHPIDTAEAVGKAASGAVQSATTALGAAPPEQRGLRDDRPAFDAVVGALKNRYGSLKSAEETMYHDPVGFLLDASSVLQGGAGLLKDAAPAASAAMRTAGEFVDPVGFAMKGVKSVASGLGEVGAQVIGKTTGVGGDEIKDAANGSPDFAANLHAGNHEAIANDVVDATKQVADQRRATYQGQLAQLPDVPMSLTPVQKALRDAMRQFKVGVRIPSSGGLADARLDFSNSTIPLGEQAAVQATWDDVLKRSMPNVRVGKMTVNGTSPAEAAASDAVARRSTAVGAYDPSISETPRFGAAPPVEKTINLRPVLGTSDMDTLKQRISNRLTSGAPTRGDAFQSQIHDVVRNQLDTQVPGYSKMTADYAEASDFLQKLRQEFSTEGQKGTQIRKLATALNQRNTYRGGLLSDLDAATGGDLRGKVAGADMQSWVPRGLQGVHAPLALGALVATHPQYLPMMLTTSPRLVGEVLLAMAKARGAVGPAASVAGKFAVNPMVIRAATGVPQDQQ